MYLLHMRDWLVNQIKINTETDCWEWKGKRNPKGYGYCQFKGKQQKAHIVAYEVFLNLKVKEQINHKCRVRHCINPSHLEDVTSEVNNRYSKGWTVNSEGTWSCKRGHLITEENTRRTKTGIACKKCQVMGVQAFRKGVSLK